MHCSCIFYFSKANINCSMWEKCRCHCQLCWKGHVCSGKLLLSAELATKKWFQDKKKGILASKKQGFWLKSITKVIYFSSWELYPQGGQRNLLWDRGCGKKKKMGWCVHGGGSKWTNLSMRSQSWRLRHCHRLGFFSKMLLLSSQPWRSWKVLLSRQNMLHNPRMLILSKAG